MRRSSASKSSPAAPTITTSPSTTHRSGSALARGARSSGKYRFIGFSSRLCKRISSPSRNTSVRKPSHFGSNCHPSPEGNSAAAVDNIGWSGGSNGNRTPQSYSGVRRLAAAFAPAARCRWPRRAAARQSGAKAPHSKTHDLRFGWSGGSNGNRTPQSYSGVRRLAAAFAPAARCRWPRQAAANKAAPKRRTPKNSRLLFRRFDPQRRGGAAGRERRRREHIDAESAQERSADCSLNPPSRRFVQILRWLGLGELQSLRKHFLSHARVLVAEATVESSSEHVNRDRPEERHRQQSGHA